MNITKKMPLFIITGANGVGKSAVSSVLFENEKDYIVLESDILWDNRFNTPEDNYREYRELWLKLCKNISQVGLPVVLCGCATPEQFELCEQRKYFTAIHYLAVVCDDEVLESRLRSGRGVNDENWIKGSISFNNWLKDNTSSAEPKIELLDCTNITAKEAAEKVDLWIRSRMAD